MKKFYVGVKAVIRIPGNGYLLLHRDYKSGDYWDVPGGRMEAGEDFTTTLHRELAEELPGIKEIKVGRLLGVFRLSEDIDENIGLILLYFEVTVKLPDPIRLSNEHESYRWFNSQDELPEGLNPEIKKILLELLGWKASL